MRVIAAFSTALLAGALLRAGYELTARDDHDPVTHEEPAAARRRAVVLCPDGTRPTTDLEPLEDARDAVIEQLEDLVALRAELEGTPRPAEADLDQELLETELVAATAAITDRVVTLDSLDCSEEPCMAVFLVDQEAGDPSNPALEIEAQLAYEGRHLHSMATPLESGRIVVIVGVSHGEIAADDAARLAERQRNALQEARSRHQP